MPKIERFLKKGTDIATPTTKPHTGQIRAVSGQGYNVIMKDELQKKYNIHPTVSQFMFKILGERSLEYYGYIYGFFKAVYTIVCVAIIYYGLYVFINYFIYWVGFNDWRINRLMFIAFHLVAVHFLLLYRAKA